jgi:hypothetical protein
LYLLIWVLADLVQALFTNMHADEAYYALYGQFLDWGYYDHPPMVALLTYLSHFVGVGALSVRFCTVLLHGATLWLVWKTLSRVNASVRDVNEFFLIAFSLFMFVLYGFITTPDAPLLFFTALFFYLYQSYLKENSLVTALFLGLTMACMLYSKYMAVLVIGFVLLSNIKLLKDWRIWISAIVALALFMPHILWQFNHDFPSLKYHFLIRKDPFSWLYPLEFLPNQLLVFNPVCLFLAFYFCWQERRNKDRFTRACVFTCVGFVLFFWVMTVNGHAEPHWTIAITIPMLFLLYRNTREELWHKRILRYILPMAILVLLVRIGLCTPFVPDITGFGNYQPAMEAIHQQAGGKPVVFYTSFQKPSLYRYHTGGNGMALSSLYNRQTQYDILQFDKDIQGKQVLAVSTSHDADYTQVGNFDFYGHEFDCFQGTNRVEVLVENQRVEADSVVLEVTINNPYAVPFDFGHPELPVGIFAAYLQGDQYHLEKCEDIDIQVIPANGKAKTQLRFKYIPDQVCVICLANSSNISVNSEAVSFE